MGDKMLQILLLIILMIGNGSRGSTNSDHPWPWCVDRSPSEDKKQLSCLKSMDVSVILRNSFNKMAQTKKDCPKCKLPIAGDEDLQSLFQFPFLVIAITLPVRASYSAYDMHIVFKERPTQEFEVGIDYAEKQAYEAQV